LLLALARRHEARLHAAEAKAAEAGMDARVLRPGKTVLRGKVLGEGTAPVVSVCITQVGRDYKVKSSPRHKWTEVSRQVEAQPFTLCLASGENVRVEPAGDAFLVDRLETEEQPLSHERKRVARLRPGERVYVEGVLVAPLATGAYRSTAGETAFTLRPVTGQRLLVSTEPLERRHEGHATLQTWWALALAACFAVVNLAAFGSFWRASFEGSIVSMHVDELRTWTVKGKRSSTPRYGVMVGGDKRKAEEVSHAAYVEAEALRDAAGGASMPFVVVRGDAGDTRFVGVRPTLNTGLCIVAWAVLTFAVVAYFASIQHRRPWYEREKVVDDGAGPLGSSDALV